MLIFIKLKSWCFVPKCTIKGGLSVMKNELIVHNCVTFRTNPLLASHWTQRINQDIWWHESRQWWHWFRPFQQKNGFENPGPADASLCRGRPLTSKKKKKVPSLHMLPWYLPIFIQVSHSLFRLHFHRLHLKTIYSFFNTDRNIITFLRNIQALQFVNKYRFLAVGVSKILESSAKSSKKKRV